MRTRSKLALAALAATLLMSLAVSSATAGHLSTSNQNFRIVWNPLTFRSEGGFINPTVECPVTLEGTFHSATIAKIEGSLIGYITRAIVAETEPPCRGGIAHVNTETLPWHVTYRSFVGTLPRITGIVLLLHKTSFEIETGGVRCRFEETGTERAAGTANREAGGAITGLTADNISLPRTGGSSFCPTRISFEGTGTVTVLGSTTRISVTLI